MLIQGDAGTGKSIMMRDVELHYWKNPIVVNQDNSFEYMIPVLVTLSSISNIENCLFESLNKTLQNPELTFGVLDLAKKQKIKKMDAVKQKYCLLVLLDGYDELRKPLNIY